MRLLKQGESLKIQNLDFVNKNKSQIKRHGPVLPSTIRSIIVGPSNCGKTNVMISLLIDPNGLRYKNIYVYSKSLYQPKYEYLKHILSNIKEISYNTFSNNEDVIPIEKAKENSIFIFDDIACEKQNNVREYFCMGRHKAIDSFFLCQTYSHISKQLIRDNANLLIIFKQDEINLRHIFQNHVNPDMNFKKFLDICNMCWKDRYGFLVIDKDSDINKGRYRKNFDIYIEL